MWSWKFIGKLCTGHSSKSRSIQVLSILLLILYGLHLKTSFPCGGSWWHMLPCSHLVEKTPLPWLSSIKSVKPCLTPLSSLISWFAFLFRKELIIDLYELPTLLYEELENRRWLEINSSSKLEKLQSKCPFNGWLASSLCKKDEHYSNKLFVQICGDDLGWCFSNWNIQKVLYMVFILAAYW